MDQERRTNKRVVVNLSAKWRGASGMHEGRVEDLSVQGCFVNTRDAVDVGEIVSLLIKLPSEQWLTLRGKVVYAQQLVGFGLRFPTLDDEERIALDQLVNTSA